MKPLYKYYPVFVALLVLAIVTTALFGGSVVRSLFHERIVAGLEDSATMVKNLLISSGPDSPASIDGFCKEAGTEYSRITIVRRDGEVLGDSIATPAEMDNHGSRPEIKPAFLGATGSSTRYSNTLDRNMVYLALPSFELDGTTVVLRVATPYRDLSGDLRGAYIRITIVGLVSLVLVSVLGFVLTSKANGAMAVISSTVEEYARGNLAFRPHVYRPPGLKRVADTISSLAEDLVQRADEAAFQRDKLEAVFAGMEEAVIVLDSNLVILEMNDSARLLSDRAGESAGADLLLAFRNSNLYEVAVQVRNRRQPVDGEIVFFSDRQRYLQVHGTVISGEEHESGDRIALVLNDVTKLKNLEEVRKDFVANVSHELKTPITAVKGYVETLLGGDYENPEISKEFLSIALQHIDRLSAIVEDLLIISRLEQDSGDTPEMEACNVKGIAESVTSLYERRAADKGITLAVVCQEGITIRANRVLLEQALSNLVDNAIKYSHDESAVDIATIVTDDSLSYTVKDHGKGIPEEHLERIFERFYRVDSGRSRELGGTGLGLSIVKHIAIAHGGDVSVTSEEGAGSTFSIILPRQ